MRATVSLGPPQKPERRRREDRDSDRLVQVVKLEFLKAGRVAHDPSQREHDEDQPSNQPVQRLLRSTVFGIKRFERVSRAGYV